MVRRTEEGHFILSTTQVGSIVGAAAFAIILGVLNSVTIGNVDTEDRYRGSDAARDQAVMLERVANLNARFENHLEAEKTLPGIQQSLDVIHLEHLWFKQNLQRKDQFEQLK